MPGKHRPHERQKITLSAARDAYRTCLRLLGTIWKEDKGHLLAYGIAVVIPSAIPFVNAYIYKLLIDAVVVSVQTGTLSVQHIFTLIALRVVTYFLQDAISNTQDYVEKLMWTRLPIYFNTSLFERVASLDMQYAEDSDFRDNLEKARDALTMRTQNLVSNLFYGLQSFLQLLIALIAIAFLNWLLIPLIALIAVPEFFYRTHEARAGWAIWSWESPLKKRYTYLAWLLQDIQSIKEIKLFKLVPQFAAEARTLQEQFYDDNARLAARAYRYGLLFNLLSTAALIGIEAYVIFLAVMKTVTIGSISFYTQVVSNFQNGIEGMLRNLNRIFENALYVKSVFEVLDAPPLLLLPAHPLLLPLKEAPPSIEFRDVSFRYPKAEKMSLEHFSLTITPGEKIALVGENGSGKSTLIKLLARFYDVTGGAILIGGTDIRELELDDWHRRLSILFQDFNRYEDTAKNNIRYGDILRPMDMEAVKRAAENGGARDVIEHLAHGYDQMLGKTFEKGVQLSTGQWQKMALARAYFRDASVLVLDEPTAAIDAKAENEIFERVERLSRNKSVILISHRFSTVRRADRIIVLREGKILEEGSHEWLMRNRGLYAELFELQAEGYA